ncbi:MAG: hypothetical protein IMW89_20115 [Ktedonobacteraceae bacterium]|nr:hypothetical protein [Ktedonobacteraceae bacterium]
MSLASFLLELYFAAQLSIAGIAKIDHPQQFQDTILVSGNFPAWSVQWLRRIFPWFEIILACFLVSGVAEQFAAVLTLVLFTIFLFFKLSLRKQWRPINCGCYGNTLQEPPDTSSIGVATILVLLAGVLLSLVLYTPSAEWEWHLSTLALLVAADIFFFWKIVVRWRRRKSLVRRRTEEGVEIITSRRSL